MSLNRHSVVGFSISALLHLSLAAWLIIGHWGDYPAKSPATEVPLNLSMFQLPSKPTKAMKVVDSFVEKPDVPRPEKSSVLPQKITALPLQKPELFNKEKLETNPLKVQENYSSHQPRSLQNTVEKSENAMNESLLEDSSTEQTEQATAVTAGFISSIEEDYKMALRLAIEAKKFYPRSARRMKREGLVEVDFIVDHSGLITNVSISSSSGVKLLDSAALKAVETLRQFRPIPDELNRTMWAMRIPVEFSLRSH
jgi:protein TonB